MDKNTYIKVTNRYTGRVSYYIEDLRIRRVYNPRETKEVTFEEIFKLAQSNGGVRLLKDYLVIRNEEALKRIFPDYEPEYFYGTNDIKRMLTEATLDEFLDCLDFAPEGVIDMIKEMAVTLPLDNVSKRKAIFRRTGFDVTKAIENSLYETDNFEEDNKPKRRVQVAKPTEEVEEVKPARRSSAPETSTETAEVEEEKVESAPKSYVIKK